MIKWYQTIPELGIKGRMNTPEEFDKIGLPEYLGGESVLDIGCNSGAFLVECKRREAVMLDGIEPNIEWRVIAYGVLQELVDYEQLVEQPYIGKKIGNVSSDEYDLVLCLSVTHVSEEQTGQEIIDEALTKVKKGGLLILEINDRLQKEPIKLPTGAKLFGKNKDNRSVWHVRKN